MSRSKTELDDITTLYAAVNSPLGLEVDCGGKPEQVRQRYYKLRRENPDFLCLHFAVSPDNPNNLWIVRIENGSPEAGGDEALD